MPAHECLISKKYSWNYLKIRDLGRPPPKFLAISRGWSELGVLNLAWVSLMAFYLMLQGDRLAASPVPGSFSGNRHVGVDLPPPSPLPAAVRGVSGACSGFRLKWRTAGKVSVFKNFLLVLARLSFWSGGWALDYYSLGFRQFPNIS